VARTHSKEDKQLKQQQQQRQQPTAGSTRMQKHAKACKSEKKHAKANAYMHTEAHARKHRSRSLAGLRRSNGILLIKNMPQSVSVLTHSSRTDVHAAVSSKAT